MGGLEKELGLGNGTIRLWDVKKPGSEKVILVAEKLGVSLDWLLLGKESNELTPDEQELINYYRRADNRGKRNIIRQAASESEEQESSTSKIG